MGNQKYALTYREYHMYIAHNILFNYMV